MKQEFVFMVVLCFRSIHFVKRPGGSLDSGSIVARLQLDDPSRIQQVQKIMSTIDR